MADPIDTYLREHVRFTGDGLPGEPSGAPAPEGDPQSGAYSPLKADLRYLLRWILTQISPFEGIGFVEDVGRSILSRTPDIFSHLGGDDLATPEEPPYFNVSIGHGTISTAAEGADIWRSTFVGTSIGTLLEYAERTEAFGNGALRFAKFSERNTALGSITMQWLGQPNDSGLAALYHDFWRTTPLTDSGWDYGTFETLNPGIRAKLVAVTSATDSSECTQNVAVGRDALVEMIKGNSNTAVGYRAIAFAYDADFNVGIGDNAMACNLLGNRNVAVGASAGYRHQEGDNNTFLGTEAGFSNITGVGNVYIGANAGTGTSGSHCIMIGYQSATGVGGGANSDRFILQNRGDLAPLLLGNFATPQLGIGTPTFADLDGTLHVRAHDSGIISVTSARTLVLEDNTTHGISILGGDSQNIYFGDAEAANTGGVQYSHSTDVMTLRAAGATQLQIGASVLILPSSMPTSASGLASRQVWVDTANGNVLKMVS